MHLTDCVKKNTKGVLIVSKSEECIICKSKIKMLLYCNGCHRRKIAQAKLDAYEDCKEIICREEHWKQMLRYIGRKVIELKGVVAVSEYSYLEALNKIEDKDIRNSIRNFVILLNQENDKAIAQAKHDRTQAIYDKAKKFGGGEITDNWIKLMRWLEKELQGGAGGE